MLLRKGDEKVPHHKQFKKALKVNEKSRLRNHAAKSRITNAVKKVKAAETQEEAQELFRSAASIIVVPAGTETSLPSMVSETNLFNMTFPLHPMIV